MIEIPLTLENVGKHYFDSENSWYQSANRVNDNRPISRSFISAKYVLDDMLHDWLVDNNIEYSLREDVYITVIIFKKDSDAMLFKLVWC